MLSQLEVMQPTSMYGKKIQEWLEHSSSWEPDQSIEIEVFIGNQSGKWTSLEALRRSPPMYELGVTTSSEESTLIIADLLLLRSESLCIGEEPGVVRVAWPGTKLEWKLSQKIQIQNSGMGTEAINMLLSMNIEASSISVQYYGGSTGIRASLKLKEVVKSWLHEKYGSLPTSLLPPGILIWMRRLGLHFSEDLQLLKFQNRSPSPDLLLNPPNSPISPVRPMRSLVRNRSPGIRPVRPRTAVLSELRSYRRPLEMADFENYRGFDNM